MILDFLRRRRGPPLRPLERKLIDALTERLAPAARDVLAEQIGLVNLVQRHVNDKEVNLYQMRRGKATVEGMPRFPLVAPEAKLASITYSIPGQPRPSRVDFWLVNGHLFSLQFSESPIRVDADRAEVQDVQVLIDPMAPAEAVAPRSLDPACLRGWLADWVKRWRVTDVRAPASPEERHRRLRQIDSTLPSDYLELVSQIDGLRIEGCSVYGLAELREVAMPDATYYILAEMADRGVLAARQGHSDGTLHFFAYDRDGVAVGSSLRAAVEELLRGELT